MIQEHETWKIHDSSKIDVYLQCHRRYFYEYILGWRTDGENHDMFFGTCWHISQEHLLLAKYSVESADQAYMKFETKYREKFGEFSDVDHFPKVPAVVLKALGLYLKKYSYDIHYEKVVHTEIAGAVSTLKHVLHFKMDSIIQTIDGMYKSREHKTGSRLDKKWRDKWQTAIQPGTYSHVLYCMYPANMVWGVEINGAIFTKGLKGDGGRVEFERVPVKRSLEMMDDWVFTVDFWIDRIEEDIDRMMHSSENQIVLAAFAKNPTSCSSYYGCPYLDFCIAWPNPLQRCYETPIGFKTKWWDPRDSERDAKKVVSL